MYISFSKETKAMKFNCIGDITFKTKIQDSHTYKALLSVKIDDPNEFPSKISSFIFKFIN
jgi:hypothetical protein